MSLTTYQICALLLGGAAVGSVSTVSVSRLTQAAIKKPSKKISASRQHVAARSAGSNSAASNNGAAILDCPIIAPFAAVPSDPLPFAPIGGGHAPGFLPPGAGGGGAALLPPPSIPEPAAWATLVAGFGLVGGAVRKSRKENNQ